MRGLPNVSFILLDEADFFHPGQQQDARDASERYIAKSNPYTVMVSTPNAPEGLFERIEKESEDTCLYKRLFLDYTYGIGNCNSVLSHVLLFYTTLIIFATALSSWNIIIMRTFTWMVQQSA
jgi:hypothetical protein